VCDADVSFNIRESAGPIRTAAETMYLKKKKFRYNLGPLNVFNSMYGMPLRRYPYFDVVVGLVWSHDPKSCAGGSVCYW
jgi:hypothetical protein